MDEDCELNENLDYESKLNEDFELKVDENSELKVNLDYESKLNEDFELKVNLDYESKVDDDYESKVDEDHESNVNLDYESNVNLDYESKVDENYESNVNEELDYESNIEKDNLNIELKTDQNLEIKSKKRKKLKTNLKSIKKLKTNLKSTKKLKTNLNKSKKESQNNEKRITRILRSRTNLLKDESQYSLNSQQINQTELKKEQQLSKQDLTKSNDQQSTEIIKLSNELISKIFDYLNIEDLIKLRLLNKEFKLICNLKLENKDCLTLLTNSRISLAKFSNNWFYTNEKQNKNNLIKINLNTDLKTLENKFKLESIFKNLKKLFINLYKYEDNLNLNETINQLTELEQLDIEFKIKKNSVLNLPKLRILNVNGYNHSNLILKTPNLTHMKCKYLKNDYYHFTYPLKMIYLFIENGFTNENLEKLINLEYLFTNNYAAFELDIFKKLTKLKELHLCNKDPAAFDYSFTDKFKLIYEEKLKLNLQNLKMFISGVDYEALKEINIVELKKLNQNNLIINNIPNLSTKLPFVEEIDFTESLKQFRYHKLTLDNIFIKFPNIKSVIVGKMFAKTIPLFYNFLSNYNLTHLTLNKSFTKQEYYDQLPDYSKTIIYLCLNTSDPIKPDPVKYDFIIKYKNLNEFETSRELKSNDIYYFFNKMDTLIKINFINGDNYVDVEFDRTRIKTKYYYRLFKTKEASYAKIKGWAETTDEILKIFGKPIKEPKKLPIKN